MASFRIAACYYSRVSGYMSAHLAHVKIRSWKHVARFRIYKGKLTQGWSFPPRAKKKILFTDAISRISPFAKLLSGIFVRKLWKSTIRRTFLPQNTHNVSDFSLGLIGYLIENCKLTHVCFQNWPWLWPAKNLPKIHQTTITHKADTFDENSGQQFCKRWLLELHTCALMKSRIFHKVV